MEGMDARVPQFVIDGGQSVFGLGLLGLSGLSMDKMRQWGRWWCSSSTVCRMTIGSTWQFFSNCELTSSILPPHTIWALAWFMFWPHLIAWCLEPSLSLSYQSPSCLLPVNAHHLHNPLTSSHKPHVNKATPRWSLVNVRLIEVLY